MEEEIYIPLKGYEEFYEISNLGNIFSKKYKRALKPYNNGSYSRIVLTNKDKKEKTEYIHRLVAINFLENPDNKKEVNHINGIKSDNRATNLEWNTKSENIKHAIKNNLFTPSKLPKFDKLNHPMSKLKQKDFDIIVKRRLNNEKLKDIAKDFGVGLWQIAKIFKRETGKNFKINKQI